VRCKVTSRSTRQRLSVQVIFPYWLSGAYLQQLDVLCQPQGFITRNVFVPVMAKETEPPVIHFVPDPSQRRLK